KQESEQVMIGFIDLNSLKRFNDDYGGHHAGNILLGCFSDAVKEVRTTLMQKYNEQIGERIFGRLGGDEIGFAIELQEGADPEKIAFDIQETLAKKTYEFIEKKVEENAFGDYIRDSNQLRESLELAEEDGDIYKFSMCYSVTDFSLIKITDEHINLRSVDVSRPLLDKTRFLALKEGDILTREETPELYADMIMTLCSNALDQGAVVSKLITKQERSQAFLDFLRGGEVQFDEKGYTLLQNIGDIEKQINQGLENQIMMIYGNIDRMVPMDSILKNLQDYMLGGIDPESKEKSVHELALHFLYQNNVQLYQEPFAQAMEGFTKIQIPEKIRRYFEFIQERMVRETEEGKVYRPLYVEFRKGQDNQRLLVPEEYGIYTRDLNPVYDLGRLISATKLQSSIR
ncbi:diguanylate cyclase, partial [Candidatus Pacearchaeota archaeon]|nr:diguanylate cyclase [Candidatus Pacearchaeota archaeon]